jgi:hypothetical protein
MHAIPWYIALLISVPQTILIIEFGFRLFNIRIRVGDTLILAVIMAGICYLLRPLALPYAVNTLMLVLLLSLLAFLICGIKLQYAFVSVILGIIIYGVLESISLPFIMKVLDISMEVIMVNPWINLVAFIPILFVTLLLLSLVIKKNFILYDFGSELNER